MGGQTCESHVCCVLIELTLHALLKQVAFIIIYRACQYCNALGKVLI